MLRAFALLFLSFCYLNSFAQREPKDNYSIDVKIPAPWIEKVRVYNYKQNKASILKEFEKIVRNKVTWVVDNSIADEIASDILNPIFTDLDGDGAAELICTLGWDRISPALTVFKKIGATWHLLYFEQYDMFYTQPDVYVANNFSKNKTVYFRLLYDRGSGIYSDKYKFIKLIGNKVYSCLEIVNEARIYGWGLPLNQNVKTRFRFDVSDSGADQITVDYAYNFFPGMLQDGDCEWCADENIALIKDEQPAIYNWDSKDRIYKFEHLSYGEFGGLTEAKITCFGDFGNDSLFVRAFGKEIEDALKNGTTQQKEILGKYLLRVREETVK